MFRGEILQTQFRDQREYVPRHFCVYCSGELTEHDSDEWHDECESNE